MWKIKNKEAVSPVIGVILMVAITVVLAAVLYVWVSGFMTAGGGGAAPTAAFSIATNSTTYPNNWTSTVTSISAKIDEGSVKWYQMRGGVAEKTGYLGGPYTTIAGAYAGATTATTKYSVSYIDNDGDGMVSTNDLIYLYEGVGSVTIDINPGDTLRLADTSGNTIGSVSF